MMPKYSIEEIRQNISCPQFGDKQYGKWGGLGMDVKRSILHMIETIYNQQSLIEALKMDNEQLQNDIINANCNCDHAFFTIQELEKQLKDSRTTAIRELTAKLIQQAEPEYPWLWTVDTDIIEETARELTEGKP